MYVYVCCGIFQDPAVQEAVQELMARKQHVTDLQQRLEDAKAKAAALTTDETLEEDEDS